MSPVALWQPVPLSQRALEAIERLSLPSIAQPLPGSVRIGLTRWLFPGPRADAVAAYQAGTALPPGAVVRESDGVLTVEAPFQTSGIFLSDDPRGCAYTITPGPSLTVDGAGVVPSGSAFCRIAPSMMDSDPEGRTIVCEAELAGATWTIMVVTPDGEHAKPQGILAKAKLAETSGDDFQGTKVQGTAKLERAENGAIVAVIATDAGPVRVVAFQTDAITALLKVTRAASCTLSKKGGSPPSAPTLTGEGFDPKESIEISFDDAPLSTVKTDDAGAFKKRVTIPPDALPGPHLVIATGKTSNLVVETPFRVLKPR